MRKSLIMFLALLLCAVIVLTVTVLGVQQGSDQIVVTESTLAGDVSAASDLQVRTILNMERRMFWQTDYTVGDASWAQTEFTFYQRDQHPSYERTLGSLDLRFASRDFGISGVVNFTEPEDYHYDLLMAPVEAVANQTAAGETKTMRIRLADYYAYYPVVLDPISYGIDGLVSVQYWNQSILNARFSIPMPENEYMEVTVEKNEQGQVVDVNCNSCYEDYETNEYGNHLDQPYMFSDSVVNEQCAYVLLRGNVDFSQLSGGYGLYRIPIAWLESWEAIRYSEPQPHLELEQLENIFPLDPSCGGTIRLEAGVDESELLLLDQTDTGTVLTVLDTDDFSMRQRLELGQDTEPMVWIHDNLVILGYEIYDSGRCHLQILQRQDGIYALWLDADMYPLNDQGGRIDPVFAFDGEKLAMASYTDYRGRAAHRIAVYDPTGLCYAGDITYNSDTLPEPPVTYNWDQTLQISWASH